MNIGECTNSDLVSIDLEVMEKNEIFRKVSGDLIRLGLIPVEASLYQKLILREELMTTGIGNGFAIPHAFVSGLEKTIVYFIRLKEPIDFKALDGKPVQFVFVLVGPEKKEGMHLKLLARLSRLIQKDEFRTGLKNISDQSSFLQTLQQFEAGI